MVFAFHTLGCKVNQYETQAMEELLLAKGHTLVPFEEKADVYIINSCTVTAVSDKKSRQAVRQARRRAPEAVVALCGCYPQVSPEEAAKLDADGAMGLMAALGQAGALIKLDRPADAVTLLQGLESRATEDGRATLRMLLGEAAEAAGKTDVAVAAYEALAASQPGLDGEFYRSRAEALGGGKTAPVKDGAENK